MVHELTIRDNIVVFVRHLNIEEKQIPMYRGQFPYNRRKEVTGIRELSGLASIVDSYTTKVRTPSGEKVTYYVWVDGECNLDVNSVVTLGLAGLNMDESKLTKVKTSFFDKTIK